MLADTLRTYYDYGRWATARVLDAADNLTPEQLLAPGVAGQRSIRDTLVHMVAGHMRWLAWWDGSLPGEEAYRLQLHADDFPDVAAIRAKWEEVEANTRAFVSGLTEADTARVYGMDMPAGTMSFRLWQMMLHIANHGTQHRSEVAAMLTEHGHSPGELDLLFYYLDPATGPAG
jgi:uncharacterized damage-inducible protein DinB